jgi:hypothetical protein
MSKIISGIETDVGVVPTGVHASVEAALAATSERHPEADPQRVYLETPAGLVDAGECDNCLAVGEIERLPNGLRVCPSCARDV